MWMETPFLTICQWHSHLLDQEFLFSVVKTFFVNGPSCCGSLFFLTDAFQSFHDVNFVFCTGFLSCQRISLNFWHPWRWLWPRCLPPHCEFQAMSAEYFHGCPPWGAKIEIRIVSKDLTYISKTWAYFNLQNHMSFKKGSIHFKHVVILKKKKKGILSCLNWGKYLDTVTNRVIILPKSSIKLYLAKTVIFLSI